MEDRILGNTGIRVSRLGLGAAKHGDVHRQDQDVERWLHHDGILRTVDESRSRLCMDIIDLIQFHGLPPVELLDEAFETLMDLKARGWAQFVGVSADGPAGAAVEGEPKREVAELARTWPLDTWQFTYNFLSQEAATELIPLLREAGIGTIV